METSSLCMKASKTPIPSNLVPHPNLNDHRRANVLQLEYFHSNLSDIYKRIANKSFPSY